MHRPAHAAKIVTSSFPASIDPITRAAIAAFIERLTPHFALREAILFGSRARGDARPDSDADVAVVLRGERGPFMQTKLAMADIAFDTMLDSGIRIQPLPIWDADLRNPDRWPNPELLHNIEHTGVRMWRTSTP